MNSRPINKKFLKEIKQARTNYFATKNEFQLKADNNKMLKMHKVCNRKLEKLKKVINNDDIWACKALFDRQVFEAEI